MANDSTMHAPGPIGTTRFGCGCTVHTDLDVNGISPWLEHCAKHEAAGDLILALEDTRRWIETLPADLRLGSIMPEKLDALIRKARGESA